MSSDEFADGSGSIGMLWDKVSLSKPLPTNGEGLIYIRHDSGAATMVVFDERLMDDAVTRFHRDIQHWRLAKVLRRIGNGIRRLLLALWWAVGRIDSFFIVSGFFVSSGIVQLIFVLSDAPTSGFDMITANDTAQLWLATGFIFLGWLTGYSRSMVLITVSALVAAAYGLAVGYGVGMGAIDMRGLTVLVNNSFLALAILRASWAEHQKTKYQAALATLKAAQERHG